MCAKKQDPSYECGISSRIKSIFIELHGYSFFHSPSEISNVDNRFIGREKIKNKLKSILVNSKTKSGAYLVTGYRGMGKSSFVSKTIEEIDPSRARPIIFEKVLRIFALLLFLSFFKIWSNDAPLFVSLVILMFSTLYLFRSDLNRNDLKIRKGKGLKEILWWPFLRLLKTLVIKTNRDTESNYREFLQVIHLTALIHILTIIFLPFFLDKSSESKALLLKLLIFSVLIAIIWSISTYLRLRYSRLASESSLAKKRKKKFREYRLFKKVKEFFNYSNRIYIKINLGYDDLKDIDILRLIARNIEKEFIKFGRLSWRKVIFGSFKFLFIFFLVSNIYTYAPVYNLNLDLKSSLNISEYFPSQTLNPKEKYDRAKSKGEPIKNIIMSCDYFLFLSYQGITDILIDNEVNDFLSNKLKVKFITIPSTFDYFFWLYFILTYTILNYLVPLFFGFSSYGTILKKMKVLNDVIDYQVTDERTGNAGFRGDFFFNIRRRRMRVHQKADIREIEKMLIDILEDFDNLSRFSVKPEFICIFDELDKIEPNENISLEQKIDGSQPNGQPETTYFSTEGVRHRQHTIFKILSNLKHFLNTAKAKFIFVAGREIYDAALADVSDRNFFIGSIFHDVIYVHSLLTDSSDERSSDITSMTEKYVCKFLFPDWYRGEIKSYSLKEYKKYLKFYFANHRKENKENNENKEAGDWDDIMIKKKIEKIIFTLQNFITYITYRSNGAPKKVTTYFENFIFKPGSYKSVREKELKGPFSLCIGFNSNNLYLQFGLYDQYSFEMISFLVNPVFLSVSKAIKDYGDKLLVSTSFLVDHLFKFHKNAFSWRNIELTPEIIDINKAPQLRELITLIMENLSNSHIMEIVSGLYRFKFRKKISEEISFLSKINEIEAAAFNFTLDESLALKHHHKGLLKDLKSRYAAGGEIGKEEFVNAVSFIHMIIGDLHFYDEEYNDAIVEYMEAVHHLRSLDFKPDNASYFVKMVRNMLKLGFALEKRKSYDDALIIYGHLVSQIIKFREVDLSHLGLKEKVISKKDLTEHINKFVVDTQLPEIEDDKKTNILVNEPEYETSKFNHTKREKKNKSLTKMENIKSNYDHEVKLPEFNSEENPDIKKYPDIPVCLSEEFGKFLNHSPFTSMKEDLLYNISSFESIRLFYQPLIAKFQMIEKTQLSGVTLVDLERIENEFNFITKTIHRDEKYLIEAQFKSKIADILYFKNGLMPRELIEIGNEDKCYCAKDGGALCSINPQRIHIVGKGYHLPCRACERYMKVLELLCIKAFNLSEEDIKKRMVQTLFDEMNKKSHTMKDSVSLRVMANTLSSIGNTFYSCCNQFNEPKCGFLDGFIDLVEKPQGKYNKFFNSQREFNKIEEVFLYYYLSYRFYRSCGENRESAVQLLKILYLLRNLLIPVIFEKTKQNLFSREMLKGEIKCLLQKIKKIIVKKAIIELYTAYNYIHRLEIEDYKDIFNYEPEIDDPSVNLKKISLDSDLHEYTVIYKELEFRCDEYEVIKKPEEMIKLCITTPYYSVNKMYNRIIDLNFKARLNFEFFRQLGFDKEYKSKKNKKIKDNISNIVDDLSKIEIKNEDKVKNLDIIINYFSRLDSRKPPKFSEIEKADEILEIFALFNRLNFKKPYHFNEDSKEEVIKKLLLFFNIPGSKNSSESPINSRAMAFDNMYRNFKQIYAEKKLDSQENRKTQVFDEIYELFEGIEKELLPSAKLKEKFFKKMNQSIKNILKELFKNNENKELELINQTFSFLGINEVLILWIDKKEDVIKLILEFFESLEKELISEDDKRAVKLIDKLFKDLKDLGFKEKDFTENFVNKITANRQKMKKIENIFKFNDSKKKTGDEFNKTKVNTAIEFLITDSIFCLQEVIKLVRLYGVTYMVNHSILAHAHKRLGYWCDFFHCYLSHLDDMGRKKIKKELADLIGPDNMQFIGTRYHYEKARKYYFSILEMHSGGKEYRNLLDKMFYLNDDFNDSIYHFSAADERYRINIGMIRKNINKLKTDIAQSSLYDYESYI